MKKLSTAPSVVPSGLPSEMPSTPQSLSRIPILSNIPTLQPSKMSAITNYDRLIQDPNQVSYYPLIIPKSATSNDFAYNSSSSRIKSITLFTILRSFSVSTLLLIL